MRQSFRSALILFLATVILLGNSWAFGKGYNSNLTTKKIQITPQLLDNDKKFFDSNQLFHFTQPEQQVVVIENYLPQDIEFENLYLVGYEFTLPLFARGIMVRGLKENIVIRAGTTFSFLIEATEQASSSVLPGGEPLLLSYKVAGEDKSRFIQFKTRIAYNEDVIFSKRNLDFSEPAAQEVELNGAGDLTKELVISNNAKFVMQVTEVWLGDKEAQLGKVDHRNCINLMSGASCKVAITLAIDEKIKKQYSTIPIWVEYYTVDSSYTNKLAVAAAIINPPSPEKNQPLLAAASGITTALAVQVSYSELVKKWLEWGIKKVYMLPVSALSYATDAGRGIVAGILYAVEGVLYQTLGYDLNVVANKFIDTGVLHGLLGIFACPRDGGAGNFGGCVLVTIVAGEVSKFVTGLFTDLVYDNVVTTLPEQTKWEQFKEGSKFLVDFGVAATARVGIKKYFKVPHGGWMEIYSDIFSGSTMGLEDGSFTSLYEEQLKEGILANIPHYVRNDTIPSTRYCDYCSHTSCKCGLLFP